MKFAEKLQAAIDRGVGRLVVLRSNLREDEDEDKKEKKPEGEDSERSPQRGEERGEETTSDKGDERPAEKSEQEEPAETPRGDTKRYSEREEPAFQKKPKRSDSSDRGAGDKSIHYFAREMGFKPPEEGRTNDDLFLTRYPLVDGKTWKIRDIKDAKILAAEFNKNPAQYADRVPTWDLLEVMNALWRNMYKEARYRARTYRSHGNADLDDMGEMIQTIRLGLLKFLSPKSDVPFEDAGGNFISWAIPKIYSAASAGVGGTRYDDAAKGMLGRLLKATTPAQVKTHIAAIQKDIAGGDSMYGKHADGVLKLATDYLPFVGKKVDSSNEFADIESEPGGKARQRIKEMWEELGGGRDNHGRRVMGASTGAFDSVTLPHSEGDGSRLLRALIDARTQEEAYRALTTATKIEDPQQIFQLLGTGKYDQKALKQEADMGTEDEPRPVEVGVLAKNMLDAYRDADPEAAVERIKGLMRDWIAARGDRDAWRAAHRREGTVVQGEGGEEIENPGMGGTEDNAERRTVHEEALRKILEAGYLGIEKDEMGPNGLEKKRVFLHDGRRDLSLNKDDMRVIMRIFGLRNYPLRGQVDPVGQRPLQGGKKGEMESLFDPEFDPKRYEVAYDLLQQTEEQGDDAGSRIEQEADTMSPSIPASALDESYRRAFTNRQEGWQRAVIRESAGVPLTTKCQPGVLTVYDMGDGSTLTVYGFKALTEAERQWAIEQVTMGATASEEEKAAGLSDYDVAIQERDSLIAAWHEEKVVRVISDGEVMTNKFATVLGYSVWVRKGCPQMTQAQIAREWGLKSGASRIGERQGKALGRGEGRNLRADANGILVQIGHCLKKELGLDDFEDRAATQDSPWRNPTAAKEMGWKTDEERQAWLRKKGFKNEDEYREAQEKKKAQKEAEYKEWLAKKKAEKANDATKQEAYWRLARTIDEAMAKLLTLCHRAHGNAVISEDVDDVDCSILAGVCDYVADKYLKLHR